GRGLHARAHAPPLGSGDSLLAPLAGLKARGVELLLGRRAALTDQLAGGRHAVRERSRGAESVGMRRRPPFALVLVALVAALAGAIALVSGTGGGDGGQPVGPVPTSRPARACITTHARATAIAKQTLRAPVAASVPASATGRTGKVTVTL